VGEKRSAAQWALLIGVPGLLLAIGVLVIVLLTRSQPGSQEQARLPRPPSQTPAAQMLAPPAGAPAAAGEPQVAPSGGAVVAETPTAPAPSGAASTAPTGGGSVASASGSAVWASFRGPGRMNISSESLARTFPSSGPRRVWQMSLGEGHAGAAVYKGRVYVLDYNVGARRDELRCFDLQTGRQYWSQGYATDIKTNHGISRTIPAIDGNYVVSLGPMGDLMCCQADTGKVLWRKNLVNEYGTKIPTWYNGQCPLIENSNVIVAPGGKALMAAIHLPTGKVTWTTPNSKGWQMTHSSIMPMPHAGKRIYVYPASGGVVGVNGRDGSLLWSTSEWTVNTSNIPTPVPLGNGRIFVCGGYNSGAAILQMNGSGTGVSVVKRIPPNTFQSHQQTPILYQGHLYGVRIPGDLVCLDLEGKVVWSSGNTARFGLGPYVMASGILYVLADNGTLVSVEANASAYKELSRAKVLSGSDAWAPIAVADGKLICRDLNTMVCLDLKQ
jgi:outer membrane protein assembly factor BamB